MQATNGTAATDARTPVTALQTNNNLSQSQSIAGFMPVMNIDAAVLRWESIQQFISRIMKPEVDFGTIPGSRKPSLLKPGAEKLTAFFGLAPEFDVTMRIEQWEGEPFFHYEIKCRLVRDGQVRGEGLGSANTRESKYRKAQPADIVNTVLKMAKKRALVDAILNTTGASQFFTQDMEDMEREPREGTREAAQAVAARKIADLKAAAEAQPKPVTREFAPAATAWRTRGEMKAVFAQLREAVGEVEYAKELERAGVQDAGEFRYLNDARACYSRLVAIAAQEVA